MSIFTKKKIEPKPIYISLDDEEYETLRSAALRFSTADFASVEEYWKVARNILLSRGISLDVTKQHDIHINPLNHALRVSEKPF